MKIEPLYAANDLRKGIRSLYLKKHNKCRRVACVAFIGADCLDYIPFAEGLEVYCWPKARGTNPQGLIRLIDAGAIVSFIDRLHTKVYWTEGIGTIVTSANLSQNALEEGNLLELGIHFDDSSIIDIDQVLSQGVSRPATKAEIIRLKRQSDLLPEDSSDTKPQRKSPVTFEDWYSSQIQIPWKFGWMDNWEYDRPESSDEYINEKYPNVEISDWSYARKGEYEKGDWQLQFNIESGKVDNWMFVNEIIAQKEGEEYFKDYPFTAVQLGRRPPYPPFSASQKRFKTAFKKAIVKFGLHKIKKSPHSKVSKEFLKLLKSEWDKIK